MQRCGRYETRLPDIECPCGAGTCIVRVSKTDRNPGRKFYACPIPLCSLTGKKCKFFKWCDKLTSDEFIIEPPVCECGAGACRIYQEISGPNAGRKFFVCPIKRGQGACSFSRLLDASNCLVDENMSSPLSTLTVCHETSLSNNDLVKEGNFSHQEVEIKSPVMDTPEHPPKLGIISELSRKYKVSLVDFQGQEDTSDERQEDTSDEPMRKNKRMRHRAPKIDDLIIDSASDYQDMPQSISGDPTTEKSIRASLLTSEVLIHQRQAEFLRQISSAAAFLAEDSSTSSYFISSALPPTRVPLAQTCLETASMYRVLDFDLKDWYGRLVFPPSRCPTFPAPKPFFCVSPSFDPIVVPRDVNVFDAEASAIVMQSLSPAESNKPSLRTPNRPLGATPWDPPGLKPPPKILLGTIMTRSILEVFEQAALHLQDRLLTLFESMDFHDHESMVREAYSVFGALEGLSVDYEPFKERVTEFIDHARSLTEIELSIHNDRSSQELVERCNNRKLQLENISRLHVETSAALKASNEHLQYLQQETSRVRDMLFQLEAKLSCCEAENTEIGTRFDEITVDMLGSELSLQVASKEAEEAQKLYQQREAERNDAKASFEKARSKLRQSCNIYFLM